jgi:hypothetical protein
MEVKRMKAKIDACIADMKNDLNETTAYQDAMEANLVKMEPNPGEKEAAVEQHETPNEDVAIYCLRKYKKNRRWPTKEQWRHVWNLSRSIKMSLEKMPW